MDEAVKLDGLVPARLAPRSRKIVSTIIASPQISGFTNSRWERRSG